MVPSNIRHGSRLALLALTLPFVLSFGHFHGFAAQAAPVISTGVALSDIANAGRAPVSVAADPSTRTQAPANHDFDRTTDPCAICAVIALAGSVLSATPPQLPLPQAFAWSYRATAPAVAEPNPVAVTFSAPRASLS